MYLRAALILLVIGVMTAPTQVSAQTRPRDNNYTALSAANLQQAQGMSDDAEAERAYRKALQLSLDGISSDRGNPTSYLHLGISYLGLMQYAAADSAFDKAEELYPKYFEEENGTGLFRENGWIQAYNDGIAKLDAGEEVAAVESLHLANLMYDRRPEAYLNLGSTLANMGDLEASIEAWQSAIALIDDTVRARPRDEAESEKWSGEYRSVAQMNLAQLFGMTDRAEEAVDIYNEILERDPDDTKARSALAIALAQSGQGEDALGIYDEILESDNASALDYYNAGVGLYTAEAYDKAAVAFEKVIDHAPMYRDAFQNLMQTLALAERYEDQVPFSGKLLDIDPNNYLAHQMHARALVQVGQETEGVAILERMQALTFTIDQMQLQPTTDGAKVVGAIINKTLEQGESVTLHFTFYDGEGNALGTTDALVSAPAQDEAEVFTVEFDSDTQVLGYSYEVMSSSS